MTASMEKHELEANRENIKLLDTEPTNHYKNLKPRIKQRTRTK